MRTRAVSASFYRLHFGRAARARSGKPQALRASQALSLMAAVLISACLSAALPATSVLAPGSAQAAVTHEYLSQITTIPSEGPHKEAVPQSGKLGGLDSMTIGSGKLYIAEHIEGGSTRRIDQFDIATGAFEAQFAQIPTLEELEQGVAVGQAESEQVYVGAGNATTGEGAVAVFGPTGNLISTWEGEKTPTKSFGHDGVVGVAVENSAVNNWASGDVYVADMSEHTIYVFNPMAAKALGEETAPVAELTESEAGIPLDFEEGTHPLPMVVDQFNGDLLVGERDGVVDIFQPTGLGEFTLLRRVTGPSNASPFENQSIAGLGADAQNGDVYVADASAGAVYQFTATGEYLGQLTGTPSGSFDGVRAVAVDPSSGHVFVADSRPRGGVVDIFSQSLIVPSATTSEPQQVDPTSAVLTGSVDLAKAGNASCEFLWGTTPELGQSAPCPGEVSTEEATVQVKLEGLAPDTTYYYRLRAGNAQGSEESSEGECEGKPAQYECFTTPGPGVGPEWTTEVAATSATLEATIRPHGVDTSYYFQYGIEDCETAVQACQNVPAPPGRQVGSGAEERASQQVQELLPGTLYHYRVVALGETKAGEQEANFGPDRTFLTSPGANGSTPGLVLPDSRVWELVSPPNKHGASIEPIGLGAVTQAAANGDAFTYGTNGATEAQPQGNSNVLQSYSVRSPSGGWTSRDIGVPRETAATVNIGGQTEYVFFSEDLSQGLVQPFGEFDRLVSSEASESTPYLADERLGGDPAQLCSSECYRPLVTAVPGKANVPQGTIFGKQGCLLYGGDEAFCGPPMVDATPDLSHVILQSKVALTEGGGTSGFGGLYEWSDGKLAPVSVLPESTEGVGGLIGNSANEAGNARHAISDDGSRVFWEGEDGHLYMRDTAKSQTVRVDVARPGAPAGAESESKGIFQDASRDGSRVFFTDTTPLTEDAGAEYEKPDLYECEMVEGPTGLHCVLSDLTPLGTDESAADVQGMALGASEDGAYVYFAAGGVLAAGAKPGSCKTAEAPAPTCNLYVNHDGQTKLIAVLSAADNPDWAGVGSISGLTARVSPDGHWLAFASNESLTGYDNHDALSGRPDEEVYLYDSQANGGAGKLVCASCLPSGARPVGIEFRDGNETAPLVGAGSNWPSTDWLAADLPGWTNYLGREALYQSRYLSNSGRLFFDSDDALVSQDVNSTWDVYEYEPPEVGSCTTGQSTFDASSDGCVALISSGASPEESAFLDASAGGGRDAQGAEGGGDVFFLTSAKLAGQDDDTSIDVYDAHECSTASPCTSPPPPPPPPCTTAESCRAAPTPQPAIFGSPATATFSGAGNVGPTSTGTATPKKVSITRSRKLSAALKLCKRKHVKAKRRACEKQARKRYGKTKAKAKRLANTARRAGR